MTVRRAGGGPEGPRPEHSSLVILPVIVAGWLWLLLYGSLLLCPVLVERSVSPEAKAGIWASR